MNAFARTAILAAAALLLSGAAPKTVGWNTTVALTAAGGHLIGNPAAPVKLVEYVSYTCPHCAHFESESEAALQLSFIKGGKGSVEIRSFLRNPIDVAASLLVECGAPKYECLGQYGCWLSCGL